MKLNPFLSYKKADIVILDGRVGKDITDFFERMGIVVIKTRKHEGLYEAVSYHPDMILYPIDSNTVIVSPREYHYYKEILSPYKIKLLKGERELNRNYPDNIAYNVARVGNYCLHNFRYTDEKVKYYMEQLGMELINIKQGYSKCSISIISNKSIITSDKGIEKALKKTGIKILTIEPGHIKLPGLEYGFIGGSTGSVDNKYILFSGDYSSHPDKEKIDDFLNKNGKIPKILSNKKIIDIGSIIPLICI
ncbi:DUF6873 family GME fold protein [Anaeromonas frigoriresistens]|nr:hypothetical protein [Anaeromonas frigoriresistens]